MVKDVSRVGPLAKCHEILFLFELVNHFLLFRRLNLYVQVLRKTAVFFFGYDLILCIQANLL